jgi:hypothetical protein
VNLSIPKNYKYVKKTNRYDEIYKKEQIERWMNWKIKISEILVDIYKTTKINNETFWSDFCDLVKIRDEIIHQKTMNSTAYLELFFKTRVFELCLSARKVVMFFKEKIKERLQEKSNELVGNEYLWPILDDKVIAILAKKGTKLRIGRIEE